MEDPDRAHTYHLSLFLIMDGISNFLQCVSILELTVMSNVLWCWFGKLPLLAFLMINYSDRRPIIMQYFVVSAVIQFVQSVVMVKLISDYETSEGFVDWFKVYIRIVLDIKFQV